MKIQYLGHSAFRLVSQLGNSVVCDPFDKKLVGYGMADLKADIVTVSHNHSDHNFVDAVGGEPAIIDCKTTSCADDICIESFECFHDKQQGAKRGKNLVFKFLIDGLTVAHLGDIGEMTAELWQNLKDIDILLLPVGGVYTIDAKEASEIASKLQARIIIPMHFAQEGGNLDISTVDEFLHLIQQYGYKVHQFDYATMNIEDKPEEDFRRVIVLARLED